jgi:hypothetical protein
MAVRAFREPDGSGVRPALGHANNAREGESSGMSATVMLRCSRSGGRACKQQRKYKRGGWQQGRTA